MLFIKKTAILPKEEYRSAVVFKRCKKCDALFYGKFTKIRSFCVKKTSLLSLQGRNIKIFLKVDMVNRKDDVQEFVSLLTSHQGKINSYILTLVPNYSDSADIMQESARIMWTRFSEFEIGTDFLSWGLSIAHYRVLEFRRKKKKIKEVGLSEDVFDRLSTLAKARHDSSSERISFLKKCFKFLNEYDQRIILLRYHENLKLKEIAGRLGKNTQNIYRNISRIQESLLNCIKRHLVESENGHG